MAFPVPPTRISKNVIMDQLILCLLLRLPSLHACTKFCGRQPPQAGSLPHHRRKMLIPSPSRRQTYSASDAEQRYLIRILSPQAGYEEQPYAITALFQVAVRGGWRGNRWILRTLIRPHGGSVSLQHPPKFHSRRPKTRMEQPRTSRSACARIRVALYPT